MSSLLQKTIHQRVKVNLQKKISHVFTWRLLRKPPAAFHLPGWFSLGKAILPMTGKPTRWAHVFLGLPRLCSPDAHTACLMPRLAQDGNLFGSSGRKGRKMCGAMLGARSFLLHDILFHTLARPGQGFLTWHPQPQISDLYFTERPSLNIDSGAGTACSRAAIHFCSQ